MWRPQLQVQRRSRAKCARRQYTESSWRKKVETQIIDKKKEWNKVTNRALQNISAKLEGATSVILERCTERQSKKKKEGQHK